MDKQKIDRFEILSQLAIKATSGEDIAVLANTALSMAAEYVGLNAAALYLWDSNYNIVLSSDFSESKKSFEILSALETDLFSQLRRNQNLASAFMSFDGNPAFHSFTLPLKFDGNKFGAVIGLKEGERNVISENLFLESLSALLALSFAVQNFSSTIQDTDSKINKERTEAVVQTAITLNHEINNPLTAILGNIQLLLMDEGNLSKDLKKKLEVVEESALKIKNVVQKLLNLTNARSTEYTNGTQMIDLSGEDSEE